MSVTLNLHPQAEQKLRDKAAQRGQTLEAYLEQLAEQEAFGANGPSAAGGETTTPRTFDEALAPVRQGFAESGLTDRELAELFEGAREEVWQEKRKGSE